MDLSIQNTMLDTETMSTAPNGLLLSIGAVRFDENGLKDEFKVNLDYGMSVAEGVFHIESSTLDWWKQQPKEILKAAMSNALPPKEALLEFVKWYRFNETWCKGASFDFPIMETYFRHYEIEIPWRFWQLNDYRTIAKLAKKSGFELVEPNKVTSHDALDDAKKQTLELIRFWDQIK